MRFVLFLVLFTVFYYNCAARTVASVPGYATEEEAALMCTEEVKDKPITLYECKDYKGSMSPNRIEFGKKDCVYGAMTQGGIRYFCATDLPIAVETPPEF